jgi:hypothetical protein
MNQPKPSLVRFSLRTLLVVMMLVCIALAATVSASPRVEYAMKWVSALAPAAAILLAAGTMGVKRAFWIGFAAFGMWAYPLMFTRAETAAFLASRFSSVFQAQLADPIAELHPEEVHAEATRHLIRALPRGETIDQGKSRAPWFWSECIKRGAGEVTEIARRTAWYNLHLAIATVGGLAAAFLFARQESRRHQQVAGTRPAAR